MKKSYKLNANVEENLKNYVYLLRDPQNMKVFYVGKGRGMRVYSHLIDAEFAKVNELKNSKKLHTIDKIHKAKKEVIVEILRHGLDEYQALEVECATIDLLGLKNLTNKIQGHDHKSRGLMNIENIKIQYDPDPAVFTENIILINVNKNYQIDMIPEAVLRITKGDWRISLNRANKCRIVCAVYHGIIRGVFEVTQWKKIDNGNRKRFEGKIADKEISGRYLKKSVDGWQKKGSTNPIRYITISK